MLPTFRYDAWWTIPTTVKGIVIMTTKEKISNLTVSILLSASLGFAIVDPGLRPKFLGITQAFIVYMGVGAKNQKPSDLPKDQAKLKKGKDI